VLVFLTAAGRSLFRTGVDFSTDGKMLFSTCSYKFPEFRKVVAARKVCAGESAQVDFRHNSLQQPNGLPRLLVPQIRRKRTRAT